MGKCLSHEHLESAHLPMAGAQSIAVTASLWVSKAAALTQSPSVLLHNETLLTVYEHINFLALTNNSVATDSMYRMTQMVLACLQDAHSFCCGQFSGSQLICKSYL